jgi:hypothetical protein
MHGPTRLGSITRRHPHTITQQDAPSPQLVTSHGWKRLIVELLSFDAALTATPRRSSSIAASTSAHTGRNSSRATTVPDSEDRITARS